MNWQQNNGHCSYGARCNFAHGVEELRSSDKEGPYPGAMHFINPGMAGFGMMPFAQVQMPPMPGEMSFTAPMVQLGRICLQPCEIALLIAIGRSWRDAVLRSNDADGALQPTRIRFSSAAILHQHGRLLHLCFEPCIDCAPCLLLPAGHRRNDASFLHSLSRTHRCLCRS